MKKIIISILIALILILIAVVAKNCSPDAEEQARSQERHFPDKIESINQQIPPDVKNEKISYVPTPEEQTAINGTEALFYGKVVDLKNEPVANADVVCIPNHDPWVSGLRRTVIKTDKNGDFLIREANAPSIHVSVSASGYYATDESRGSFGFAELPGSAPKSLRERWKGIAVTSQENPKIFILRKMGTREPLLHRTYSGIIKEQKTYLIGLKENQSILVKYTLDPTPKRIHKNGWSLHNWGVEITMIDGGLIKAEIPNKEISESFIAPLSGYQPSVRFEYNSSMDDVTFKRAVRSQFFAKFTDGTYARFSIDFEMDPKRPFGSVESWYNPSGQQATEFDPSIQIRISP